MNLGMLLQELRAVVRLAAEVPVLESPLALIRPHRVTPSFKGLVNQYLPKQCQRSRCRFQQHPRRQRLVSQLLRNQHYNNRPQWPVNMFLVPLCRKDRLRSINKFQYIRPRALPVSPVGNLCREVKVTQHLKARLECRLTRGQIHHLCHHRTMQSPTHTLSVGCQ